MTGLSRLGALFVLLTSLAAGGQAWAQSAAPASATALRADDMTLGDPKAPVTVIEYASLSCSHCAHFNNDIFPAFKAKYVDSGQVFYVYREFFTEPVDVAAAGALIARCAPRKRYFDVIDSYFHSQAQIYADGSAAKAIVLAGKAGGLNQAQINACFANPALAKALNDRVLRSAQSDHIQATPTFVIRGKAYEGVQTLEQLDAEIAGGPAPAPAGLVSMLDGR